MRDNEKSKYKIVKHVIDLCKICDKSDDLKIAKNRARLKSCASQHKIAKEVGQFSN